jgi:hypothetical protein
MITTVEECFTPDMQEEYSNNNITDDLMPYSEDHYMFYISLRFNHHTKHMRRFKNIYLKMNPHLTIYKEEFKCHRFHYDIFEEEYNKLKCCNISCLK